MASTAASTKGEETQSRHHQPSDPCIFGIRDAKLVMNKDNGRDAKICSNCYLAEGKPVSVIMGEGQSNQSQARRVSRFHAYQK